MKNKLKTLKNEIKAKIANGIWKFRTKFWNDSIKIYNGHVVHSSLLLNVALIENHFSAAKALWLIILFSLSEIPLSGCDSSFHTPVDRIFSIK